ncbi:MAG: NAD(P)H-dependent oxidoreductase [Pseudomonadota bacterium]
MVRIVGLCGSLRQRSYNMYALLECQRLLPEGMEMEIASLVDIPMFNQDLCEAGFPPTVIGLRDKIRTADGVLLVTPEYNFSVPAVLKNAIDWCSRGPDQAFHEKPVAIVSAATGPLGGARVQYDLRRILTQLWAHVLPRPEIFIGNAASKFDEQGRLVDDATTRLLTEQLNTFRAWAERMRIR